MHSVLIATAKPNTDVYPGEHGWEAFLVAVQEIAKANKSLQLLAPSTILIPLHDDISLFLDVGRLMATYPCKCIFFSEKPQVHSGLRKPNNP